MAFNTRGTAAAKAPKPVAAIQTAGTTVNAKGVRSFSRDAKSELFLLAVGRFFGKDTFYETGLAGTDRMVGLVHTVARDDPKWLLGFVGWLRQSGFVRTAALVIGLEGAKAIVDITSAPIWPTVRASALHDYSGEGYARKLTSAGILRGDEPGEAAAYWASKYGSVKVVSGKSSAPKFPKPIKRGIADALVRIANERSVAKYDTSSRGYSYADLIQLTHPSAKDNKQAVLFKYLLDKQYNKDAPIPAVLKNLAHQKEALATLREAKDRNADVLANLADAKVDWQKVASQGAMTRKEWEAVIPTMNYMALLRNLRNFDHAGISDEVAAIVQAKLVNPAEVKASKQFPLRFLSAFLAVPSLRWSYTLAKALDLSLSNVPALAGRTLVLVDTSGSMNVPWNDDADRPEDGVLRPQRWDAAALFGIALAARSAGVELFSYASGMVYSSSSVTKRFDVKRSAETLKELGRWQTSGFNMGGGTPTGQALKETFNAHDRVVIITDEQHDYLGRVDDIGSLIPAEVPLYTFNIAGYKAGQTESKDNRYTFGGLNDQAFMMINWLSDAASANWPWEQEA